MVTDFGIAKALSAADGAPSPRPVWSSAPPPT